jgi:hypothetical protein
VLYHRDQETGLSSADLPKLEKLTGTVHAELCVTSLKIEVPNTVLNLLDRVADPDPHSSE